MFCWQCGGQRSTCFFFPPRGTWGSNLGNWALWERPLPTEPSFPPCFLFLTPCFYFMCVVLFLHVCLCTTCVLYAWRGQTRGVRFPRTGGSCETCHTESPGRAAAIPNHWSISPGPLLFILKVGPLAKFPRLALNCNLPPLSFLVAGIKDWYYRRQLILWEVNLSVKLENQFLSFSFLFSSLPFLLPSPSLLYVLTSVL